MNHQPPPYLGGQGRTSSDVHDCGRTMVVLTLVAIALVLALATLTFAGGAS